MDASAADAFACSDVGEWTVDAGCGRGYVT